MDFAFFSCVPPSLSFAIPVGQKNALYLALYSLKDGEPAQPKN
jgi:hypothetical protein